MRTILALISFIIIVAACNSSTASIQQYREETDPGSANKNIRAGTLPSIANHSPAKEYSDIEYDTTELLAAASGTKSVLFNRNGSKLYAMNLEGMSVYEFDQPTRKITRKFRFKPSKGTGWDYEKHKAIPSYGEKPVEACLSHDDKILWVSLHNAGGIVPIRIDTISANAGFALKRLDKKIMVHYPGTGQLDSFYSPLIKTGKTPKIISRTADNKYLLVSNWHSNNVTVLETNPRVYPFAKAISTVAVPSIPRGIAIDDKNNRSFVAIMGGASIDVINNSVWMKEKTIEVASNPRHILMDSGNHIFVSYNKLARIACLDANNGKTLFSASTAAQPRTIMLSKNQKFLFVTCYSSDTVEVFKVTSQGFQKIVSLPCKGHPVGVDIFEDDTKLEAWVCSYNKGSINIFSFNKK